MQIVKTATYEEVNQMPNWSEGPRPTKKLDQSPQTQRRPCEEVEQMPNWSEGPRPTK